FVEKGHCFAEQAGREEKARPGDLFLIFPGFLYSIRAPEGSRWQTYYLDFACEGLTPLLRSAGITPRNFLRRGVDRARLKACFANVLRWAEDRSVAGRLETASAASGILAELVRASEHRKPTAGVHAARRLLDERLLQPVAVRELARVAGL